MNFKILILFLIPCLSLIASADQGQGPSAAQMAAFKACVTASGMPAPHSCQQPTDSQLEQMRSCMSEKGYDLPAPPQGQRPQPPPECQNAHSSDATSSDQ